MDTRFRPVRAVLFVLLCLALLAFTYLLVFRVDFGGATMVTVRFDSIGTIQPGSPIRQSGVRVGSVSRVELAPDQRGQADITLSLYKGTVVRQQDRVSIVTGGLLGDQYIDIAAGPGTAKIVEDHEILKGQSGLDWKVLVDGGSSVLTDVSASAKTIASFLTTHESDLDQILSDTKRGVRAAADAAERANSVLTKVQNDWDPTIGEARTTLASLRKTSDTLQSLIAELDRPGGVAKLLAAPATSQTTQKILADLSATTESLKTITSTLEKALQ